MTANTNPDPHADASDETINICGPVLERMDDSVHGVGIRYRLALLALFEQVLSNEQLEAIAFEYQWPLERGGADIVIAAKAITRHCDRTVRERGEHQRKNAALLTPDEHKDIHREVQVMQQIGERWQAKFDRIAKARA